MNSYKGVKKLPKYVCVVIDKNGQKIKQKVEGPSSDSVSSVLKSKGFYLVSIKEETIFDKDKFKNQKMIDKSIENCVKI